ncbi:RNA-directed DNA polymerase [Desmonostoc muscorum CCALA 125]|nr:RNA-directed DNA polymerase [Desmonostoc muscorum CCALA 125]
MENPAKSKLETIEGIVEALNGELRIVWEPGRVITLQLDNEQMTALEERAKNEGVTVSKVAEQLLQLALSGALTQKPKKLTELVIAEETKIYRSMHPLIESAYSAVHQWLATRPEAHGYKEIDYSKNLEQTLGKTDLKNIAFQFYTLFPSYDFQAAHVEDYIISSTRLESVLKHNRRICILDVGCAMGAASAALIEKVITWQQDENTPHPIEIFCLGIDPSIDGIIIYSKLMQEIKQNVIDLKINLEFKPICDRFSTAIIIAIRYLQEKLKDWKQPVLSNLFLMQLDSASSPNQDAITRRTQYNKLQALGLEPDLIIESTKEFWQEEMIGYKQLFDAVPVEELHLLTIGTKNLEKYIKDFTIFNNIQEGIQEISKVIEKEFNKKHRVNTLLQTEQKVNFENPVDSYWYEKNKKTDSSDFYTSFQAINNGQLAKDQVWNQLISQENLELAWVRARKNLLDESLYDEIEIRLFEINLDQNVQNIREKLTYYAEDAIPNNQEISFKLPKSSVTTRPKQLSRLEEEIIATALMQTIGKNTGRKFSAYRLQKDSDSTATEDLYEHWWELYREFKVQVRESAKKYPEGAVLRTDIASYYKQIVKQKLLDTTIRELDINSNRIYWLLEKLFNKDLDGHDSGRGIKQGTITSGFYANLYLSDVDDKFNKNRKFNVKYHRYVDDIIIIVPNAQYIREVESVLTEELKNIDLNLNQDKTEYYATTSEFVETINDDDEIEVIRKKFNFTLYYLWVMDANYQNTFHNAINNSEEQLWWQLINIYQQCLYSLEIYVTKNYLSRKIYQNLFLSNLSVQQKLNLPILPNTDNFSLISNWTRRFKNLSGDWLHRKDTLKQEVVKFFIQNIKDFVQVDDKIKKTRLSISKQEKRQLLVQRRRLETRVRFAVNKLAILGFEEVWQEIINLICSDLFVIRDVLDVVISLARQGYTDAIKQIWKYYQNKQQQGSDYKGIDYIRAVILESLRFLPNLDVQDWELIFEAATEGTSDIERLKATETWLYLAEFAKPFVLSRHIQAVINALNKEPQPFLRLKKNYILILGIYQPDTISEIRISSEEKKDYLIQDSLKLIEEGTVLQLFKEDEPAVLRHYYNIKKATDNEDKTERSFNS